MMKLLWLLLISLSAVSADVCPSGVQCPGTDTCCKMPGGQYGCCPYPVAVCCSDLMHCCPNGFKCAFNRCLRKENISISETVLVKNDNTCPNKKERCPNKFTCCPAKQAGQYGCCPLPNGICCDDNIHCCPSGATCDLNKRQCSLNGISIPLIHKSESIPFGSSKDLLVKTSLAKPVNTICPDPRYQCSGADPCCRTPGGAWTCCMYPYGNCCPDGLHCCPYGMTCIHGSYCVKGNLTVPTKPSPLAEDNSQNIIICPDKSQCPNGDTCCKMPGDKYGCCPFPDAVCCPDEIHCCPHDFKCDVQSRGCTDGIRQIPWLTKTPAF